MEIHFWTDCNNNGIAINSYREAAYHIIHKTHKVLHTTQMCFLSTALFQFGYRVFVHDKKGEDIYEIKLGENERTSRIIRPEHNLFQLWQAGEFDKKED
ncbi:MAG: hypothetical protein IJT36_01680 [Alphaproteobacteria bacterium]|nr:hypothetical protein [Alphaproteobacteria bacterium]